jgi:hypothetical protein
MESIVKIIFIICAVVLPILIVWLNNRKKINESNQRTQIVLAAIEKNKETDVEDLLKKMAPQKKLLKEKLLTKLLWGGIIAFVGFSIFASNIWLDYLGGADPEMLFLLYVMGGILFGIGLAFIINYFVGKKMLAKELEAEEKKLAAEANL